MRLFLTRSYLAPPASTATFAVVPETEDMSPIAGHFSVPQLTGPPSNPGRVQ